MTGQERSVFASAGDVVAIRWRYADGRELSVTVTAPPAAVLDSREKAGRAAPRFVQMPAEFENILTKGLNDA